MFNLLLALSLLTASPDSPITVGADPIIMASLQAVAVRLEVMDPRELRYVLARLEDFQSDVKLLRRRFHDLRGAPLLIDSERFPNRDIVSQWLAQNRVYQSHLLVKQDIYKDFYWEYNNVINDNDWLYKVWDTVRDCRCEYYYVTVRRQALRKLIELVGPECYYSGVLPPPVPLYAYREMLP